MDTTDIHNYANIGNGYSLVGEQIIVDSPGRNKWYALFGSLIYPTGEGVYTIHYRKRHQEVKAHLECLFEFDPDGFFFVVMDNAPAHKTPKLNDFWKKHKDCIELIFLPTYSPHLNLIERLWKLMRGKVTKNQFYESLDKVAQAVVDWFEKLEFAKFCSLMGIDENEFKFV